MDDRTPHRAGPAEQLRAVGLRVTAPRVATLDWLSGNPHSTADQVADGVRARLGSVSTQAVYDVLHVCAENGLLRRIEPAGHPARYETRTADQHHHVVCRVCGRTEDVDGVVGGDPCLDLDLPTPSGFVVDGSEVVFWGLCPDCDQVADRVDA